MITKHDLTIKKAFVAKILDKEKERFNTNQSRAISRMLNFRSGNLLEKREFSISSPDMMDGQLSLKIPVYGRFLDIKPKNRKMSQNHKRMRNMKQYPIYNCFAFGHYYSIANQLMYGLTEAVAEDIKQNLI